MSPVVVGPAVAAAGGTRIGTPTVTLGTPNVGASPAGLMAATAVGTPTATLGASFLLDTFADTAATALTSHTGEAGAAWTRHTAWSSGGVPVVTDANRVRADGGSVPMWASGSPSSADYTVTAQVYAASVLDVAGVLGRVDTSWSSWYAAVYDAGAGAWVLRKMVFGTQTDLGSYAQTLTVGQTYAVALVLAGSSISLKVDGVVRVGPVTDTEVTAAGKAGVFFAPQARTNTTGLHIDRVEAT